MPDWTKSMQQTFEFYTVNSDTWKDEKLLNTVKSATITRDSEVDTLGSATFDIVDSVGECYIRIYLITIQNGVREKHPLGTFLVQTPSSNHDGKIRSVSMDAYTPLLELKENQPDLGYYVPKNVYHEVQVVDGEYVKTEKTMDNDPLGKIDILANTTTTTGEQVFKVEMVNDISYYCIANNDTVMSLACRLLRQSVPFVDENGKTTNIKMLRAPVIEVECYETLKYDFVSETDDTWFSFIKDLVANVDYEFSLDDLGRVTFTPKTDIDSLRPVWTYTDDNSSILYPEITMNHDLYGIPNVVEVIYSSGNEIIYSIVKNEDVNSPTSIPNRGREIKYRVTDPELAGIPTQAKVDDYATRLLEELSSIEYTVSYSHGYCPVRLGDCVRLNYDRAGIKNVKAKVISQSIKCGVGCKVTEKAVFTTNLWR